MSKFKLSEHDGRGGYRFEDGCRICYFAPGKYHAYWANGAVLTDENDARCVFKSAQEAAEALATGGEGPAAKPSKTTTTIDGQLEIDHERGVIYFHNGAVGRTELRICQLPTPIPRNKQLDIIHMYGVDWSSSLNKKER